MAAINERLRDPDRPSMRALAIKLGIQRDALARHVAHHLNAPARVTRLPDRYTSPVQLPQGREPQPPQPDADPSPDRLEPSEQPSGGDGSNGLQAPVGVPHVDDRPPTERFLEAYRASGNLSQSAATAGVSRGQVYRWREHDDAFNAAFVQAEIEAVEALEAEARTRATRGAKVVRRVIRGGRLIETVEEWRPSDAMLIKLLQALRPEKYGDKLSVTQTTIVKTIDSEAWEAV